MRWHILLSLMLVAVTGPATQFSERYGECIKRASNQAAITRCSTDEAQNVEAELSAKYSKALTLAASDSPEALPKIRAAQSAWDNYVDAYIEATYPLENKQGEYGTSYVANVALLRVKLVLSQFPVVDDLIARYTPHR